MRKIRTLTLLLLFISCTLNAQILQEKSVWRELVRDKSTLDIYDIYEWKLEGDTTINQQKYLKLYRDDRYFCAVRESVDQKIYIYFDDDDKEYIIYDFDWKVGKELPIYGNGGKVMYYKKLDKIDRVKLSDGKYYEMITLPKTGVKCIRGIGNTNGFLVRAPAYVIGQLDYLLSYSKGDQLVYENPLFQEEAKFFKSNSSWEILRKNRLDPQQYTIDRYKLEGDTIIKKRKFSKVYRNDRYYCSLYEDELHILYISYKGQEFMLYDFRWENGKTLVRQNRNSKGKLQADLYAKINKVDSLQLLDGKYYKCIKDPERGVVCIQGLGDLRGFFEPMLSFSPSSEDNYLLSFSVGDKLLYENKSLANPQIERQREYDLRVYAKGNSIVLELVSQRVKGAKYLLLFDALGAVQGIYGLWGKDRLELKFLPKGIYFYQICTEQGERIVGKIIL